MMKKSMAIITALALTFGGAGAVYADTPATGGSKAGLTKEQRLEKKAQGAALKSTVASLNGLREQAKSLRAQLASTHTAMKAAKSDKVKVKIHKAQLTVLAGKAKALHAQLKAFGPSVEAEHAKLKAARQAKNFAAAEASVQQLITFKTQKLALLQELASVRAEALKLFGQ